jgi:hypothetical protein
MNPKLRAIIDGAEYKAARFDVQRACWTYKPADAKTAVVLRGVRRLLGEHCWPHYDYKTALRHTPQPPSTRVSSGVRSARGGRNRGSAVQEQLHAIAAHGFQLARQMYAAKQIEILDLVVKLLCDFGKRNWHLVCAELPVYDERDALRVGSSIDLVCQRKSDAKLVLLELKVGGDNYRSSWNRCMENELAPYGVHNSPTNQAKIQLIAYKALFERCYRRYVGADDIFGYAVVFLSEACENPVYVPLGDNDFVLQPVVMCALSAAGGAKRRGDESADSGE